MSSFKLVDPKPQNVEICFTFPVLNKMFKMKVNKRATLKSWRIILANRSECDFAHMKLKFMAATPQKEVLDPEIPIYQLGYFKKQLESYKLEVDVEYEGG